MLDFQRVPALVGHQSADVDGKVLLIRQRRHQREHQPIELGRLVQIARQLVLGAHRLRDKVLAVVVFQRHFVEVLVAPLLVPVVVIVLVDVPRIVLAEEVDFLVAVEVAHVDLFQGDRRVHTLHRQIEIGHHVLPLVPVVHLYRKETIRTGVWRRNKRVPYCCRLGCTQASRTYANRLRGH